MKRFRALALVAVPAALLVGSAAPTLAADDSAPREAATTDSSCRVPGANEVVTAEDSFRLAEACGTASQAPVWHWMGNYGSVYEVQDAANGFGVGAGGLITQGDANGLFPTFMYY